MENPALTDEEIAEYEALGNASYFTAENFRVDFSQSWAKFDFNIAARDFFLRHLISALKGGSYHKAVLSFPDRYITEYHLGAAIDAYIEHCRTKIRKLLDPPESGVEEEEEKKARARARKSTVSVIASTSTIH